MTLKWTGERATSPDFVPDPRYRSRTIEYDFALPHVEGKTVLDAGCGDGYAVARIAERAHRVVGIDVAVATVEAARARYPLPNVSFQVVPGLELPFPDGAFGGVTSFQVIEHVTDAEKYVAGIARVLQPDGVFVVTTPNRLTSVGMNPYHLHEFTPDELRQLLSRHFDEVTLLGYHGSEAALEHWRLRARVILALDVFRLREVVPRGLLLRVYPWMYWLTLGIRRTIAAIRRLPKDLEPTDFTISSERLDEALGLMAVAARPRSA